MNNKLNSVSFKFERDLQQYFWDFFNLTTI